MVDAPTLIVVMSLRLAIPWWVALRQSPPPLHQLVKNLMDVVAVCQRTISGTFLREATNGLSGTFLDEATGLRLRGSVSAIKNDLSRLDHKECVIDSEQVGNLAVIRTVEHDDVRPLP